MSLLKITGILKASKRELNLKQCLKGGQSFRWSETSVPDEFIGVIEDKIYVLRQNTTDNCVDYTAYTKRPKAQECSKIDDEIELKLKDYFRLDTDLETFYQTWSKLDSIFHQEINKNQESHYGIRVMRQHPVENLYSFICSSNNNIKRITQMVENLCIHYGKLIGELNGKKYYSFPTINSLCVAGVEEKLRKLSFGYRAKFIQQASLYLQRNYADDEALMELRKKPYRQVVEELVNVPGIGNKVADCVCLMSMDKLEAVPVDTHILKIARVKYNFMKNEQAENGDEANEKKKKNKGLTKRMYNEIGDKFRDLWGDYAGWTQTVLFINDLKM